MKKLTQKEFESKLFKKYPELTVLSTYINIRTPILVRCSRIDKLENEHGNYIISSISSVLTGKNNKNGCKQCSNESRAKAKTLYNYNESFFSVAGLKNSYWAGFIAADGCISARAQITIKLSQRDVDHLKKFNSDIKYNGKIYQYSRITNFGNSAEKQKYNGKECKTAEIILCNAQKPIYDLCENFNVYSNKSLILTHPLGLSEPNELAFIRGYIDGDGYIEYSPRTRISICGTEATLTWIKKIFDKISPSTSTNKLVASVRKHSQSDNLYTYEVGHNRAKKILNILSELNTPYLSRKWDQSIT